MTKNGHTANGVAHFAPMMELKAPQWNMRNPFNDLIAIALKEREMELKEKEMGLKEKGLGLDEQKFAYGAANDEINRQHDLKLKEIQGKNDLDKLIYEHKYKQGIENAREKRLNEIGNLLNSHRGNLSARKWIETNPAILKELSDKFGLIDIYNAANTIDGFYTSNGNGSNGANIVNGGNVITIGGSFQGEKNGA